MFILVNYIVSTNVISTSKPMHITLHLPFWIEDTVSGDTKGG